MSDNPFHVAGGAFISRQPMPADGFANVLRQPGATEAGNKPGAKRRKLWVLPHKFHCPIIGVCFEVGHLRQLMAKVMLFPDKTTDFVLHTTAVGACETRSQLAELLQKNLEKRFHPVIRRFAMARNSEELQALWRAASQTGSELPGALWASSTHPACDTLLEQEIYADIHMIQHQVGTAGRASLSRLKDLQAENRLIKQQLIATCQEMAALRTEKSNESRLFNQNISALRVELAGKEARAAHLTGQFDLLRQSIPDLKERQALARRASDAEARALALTAYAEQLEERTEHLQQVARHADAKIKRLLANDERVAEPASVSEGNDDAGLVGKCILCVGGRTGSVENYRQIVERRGGRFLHHDGGLEENLHRIDTALAAADLIVCQAGCISHNAYWRVKEQCKRTGKQCIFVRSAGISSFQRLVDVACEGNMAGAPE